MPAISGKKRAVTFDFEFDPKYRAMALLFGVTPDRTGVEITDRRFIARYGFWSLETELANISGFEVSGPYRTWTTIGPARLSLADRGLTFASNGRRGVCIKFKEPVRGIEPTGTLRHPGLTVTVSDVDGLARALASATTV